VARARGQTRTKGGELPQRDAEPGRAETGAVAAHAARADAAEVLEEATGAAEVQQQQAAAGQGHERHQQAQGGARAGARQQERDRRGRPGQGAEFGRRRRDEEQGRRDIVRKAFQVRAMVSATASSRWPGGTRRCWSRARRSTAGSAAVNAVRTRSRSGSLVLGSAGAGGSVMGRRIAPGAGLSRKSPRWGADGLGHAAQPPVRRRPVCQG
jgi:hypothetical protein